MEQLKWDRVYFINVDVRTDRLAHFLSTINKSRLLADAQAEGKLQRFEACTPDKNASPTWYLKQAEGLRAANMWCCRESHLRVWSDAITHGYQHVLIFEDDAVIYPNFDRRFEEFAADLPAGWLGYQLGGNGAAENDRVTDRCYRMRGHFNLHCYGLNRAGLQRTFDHVQLHNETYPDHATRSLQLEEPHFYRPLHWFAGLLDDYSDNSWGKTNWGELNRPTPGYDW